jgi:hypothetical protein
MKVVHNFFITFCANPCVVKEKLRIFAQPRSYSSISLFFKNYTPADCLTLTGGGEVFLCPPPA